MRPESCDAKDDLNQVAVATMTPIPQTKKIDFSFGHKLPCRARRSKKHMHCLFFVVEWGKLRCAVLAKKRQLIFL